MRFILALILLAATSIQAATTIVTATVTVTNTAANGNTITVNGDARTWTNTVTSFGSQIQVTNSITTSATNLLLHSLGTGFSGPIVVSLSASNSVSYRGNTNEPMTVTLGGSWGTVSYDTQTVTALQLVRVPQSSEPASVRTNVSSYLVTALSTYSTNLFETNAVALGNYVALGTTQSLTNKTIKVSTFRDGYVSNSALQQVTLSFDNTATNKDALHFYNSSAARKYAIGPDAAGKPSLYDVTSSTYMGTAATYTPSGGMLLSYATATNIFPTLAANNALTGVNQFTTISNSTVTSSFITNSGAYLTNLVVNGGTVTFPDTSSSTIGVISQTTYRFAHTYGSSGTLTYNLFMGPSAGNFTLTGTGNYFIGGNAGHALTSGQNNTGIGTSVGAALTTGGYNTFVGSSAGGSIVTNIGNVAIGNSAGPGGAYDYTASVGYSAVAAAQNYGALGANTYTYHWSVPSSATASARAQIGGVIAQTTSLGFNTAATETTLDTVTVKSNTLAEAGDSVRYKAHIWLVAAASTDKRVKIKWGGTTIFDSSTFTQSGSAAYATIEVNIQRQASNSQYCSTTWVSGATNYKTDVQVSSGVVSDSADQTIVLTGQATGVEVGIMDSKTFWEPTAH